ncbi:ferritin-like domain-containing protein [Corynebacterium sp. CCM 9185]|uniref:DUF4439 domain-containing protein n=1 Tax=Corynebacterium marambiense TaxID=2765364 RepID=A0ABS0VV99_9CORY|nr:DUF4439 domain-containing protein [Corynebacterium marambiense]MCK7663039.1 ferritin-like domain-containing protein [Corynebacterium marambiense]
MKRRRFSRPMMAPVTTLSLLLAGCLSACQITPSPEPDPALAVLSADAHIDVAELSGTDPRGAAVRERHAEALDAEIRRLCGVLEDGSTPDSCTVPVSTDAAVSVDTGSGDVLPDSAALIARKAASAPKDSVLKLARMHGELAVITGTTPEPSATGKFVDGTVLAPDSADLKAAERALEWQYSAIYGLGVAQAWADSGTAAVIGEAVDVHRQLANQLHELLSGVPGARSPVPAAGYEFSGGDAPTDPDSALAAAVRIETDSVLMWQAAAAGAEKPGWRVWCLLAGSTATLRAVPLLAIAGTDPAAAGLLDLE